MIRTLRHVARVPDPTGGTRRVKDETDVARWWQLLRTSMEERTGLKVDWREDRRKAVAYVNWSRWVADCPECNAGMDVDPDVPRTACAECGGIYLLDVPKKAERAKAEALLSARGDQRNRNWDRHKGENVKRLEAENRLLVVK